MMGKAKRAAFINIMAVMLREKFVSPWMYTRYCSNRPDYMGPHPSVNELLVRIYHVYRIYTATGVKTVPLSVKTGTAH